jgi:hypothetical protein
MPMTARQVRLAVKDLILEIKVPVREGSAPL